MICTDQHFRFYWKHSRWPPTHAPNRILLTTNYPDKTRLKLSMGLTANALQITAMRMRGKFRFCAMNIRQLHGFPHHLEHLNMSCLLRCGFNSYFFPAACLVVQFLGGPNKLLVMLNKTCSTESKLINCLHVTSFQLLISQSTNTKKIAK